MKTKLHKYDNYKNSGVEWLGEIPEHWEVKKLKHLIQSKTGFAFQSDKFSDEGIPLIRISDLNESGIVLLDKAPKLPRKNEKYLKEYGLKRNDILFAMTGGTIGKVATYNQDTPALLNQRVCLFRIYDKNLRKIVYYWMQTLYWKNYIDLKSIGGAQPNISDVTVLNLQIFVSNNQEEQTAIAHFLDDKTTKIDQAIAIKQKQIELLKERRQILIHKAVTRGLNDNVKLKDSGVEWIGEIPEGWEVKRLKYVANLVSDKMISKGNPLNYIGMENIESWTGNYVSTNSEAEGLANYFKKGDILFGKLRPYLAKVYLAKNEGICTTEFLVYRNKMINYVFINRNSDYMGLG